MNIKINKNTENRKKKKKKDWNSKILPLKIKYRNKKICGIIKYCKIKIKK